MILTSFKLCPLLHSSSSLLRNTGQWFALFAMLISLVATTLYLYGVTTVDLVPGIVFIAFTTAIALFTASLGVLIEGGRTGPFRVLWRDGSGGILARRLFPFILLMPILVGWLRYQGELAGYYTVQYGIAIVTLSSIVGFALMTWWIATSIDKYEAEKQTIEGQLAQKALMIEQSFEPMFVWDLDDGIIEWNPGCERLYGFVEFAAIGRQGHELLQTDFSIPPEDFFALLDKERWWSGEISQTRKDGSTVISESRFQVIESGGRKLVLQTERDISERKAFEEELIRTRDFNKDALNAMPGIVYLFNTKGKFLSWNDNFEEVSGYSDKEIPNMHPTEFFRGGDIPEIAGRIGEAFEQGEAVATAHFVSKDGTATPHYFTGKRVVLNGELCLIGMGIDISDRVAADRRLQESEERYRFLFVKNPFPMWVYDIETLDFIAVNPAAVKTYGYTEEEFLSMDITVIRPDEAVSTSLENVNERPDQTENAGVWVHRKKDGTLMEMKIVRDELTLSGRHCRLILAQDVTEHNQAIEALRESEARYKLLFENNPYPMWVYDRDSLRFLAVNNAAIHSYGYTEDEFLSMTLKEIRPAEDISRLMTNLNATEQELAESEGWRHVKKDQSIIEVDITSHSLQFSGHHARLVLANDVTDRNHALRKLNESEVLFRSAFNQQYQFMAILAPDGCVREINDLPIRVTGFGKDEFVGHYMWETPAWRNFPEFEEFWKQRLKLVADNDQPIVIDDIYQLADGTIRSAECSISAVRGVAGAVDFFVVQANDSTDKKEAEEKLRRSEEQFRSMFEIASVGILQIDVRTGKVLICNEKYSEITGYSLEELRNIRVFDLNHPNDIESDLENFKKAVDGLLPQYISEIRYIRKDGSEIWVRVNGTFFRTADGVAVRTMAVVEDISARKYAEDELLSLNAELERRVADSTVELKAVNQELEAFAYSVSHDLRAPLRAMDGFSQALVEDYSDKLDEKALDYLHRVRAASRRMESLIEGLLKLSRVTRTELHRERVDISAIAWQVAEQLRAAEPQRNVNFRIAENLEVDCDGKLVKIALENLIGNAWKFSSKRDHSEIELGVAVNEGRHELFVRDNGAGFDMKYAEKLFGAFQRLHRVDEFQGTGIGLATVQRIIHLHGGHIRAESEPDAGATFYFSLSERQES